MGTYQKYVSGSILDLLDITKIFYLRYGMREGISKMSLKIRKRCPVTIILIKRKKGERIIRQEKNRETACGDLKLGPANSAFPLEIWFDRSSMDDEIYPHPDIKISVLKEGAGCDKKYLSYHFLSKYVENWWDFYEMEAKDKKNRVSKKDILRVLHFIDSNADMLCLYYGIDMFTGKRMDYKINEEKFRKAVVVRATVFFDR